MSVHVARQPILDRKLRLHAYELLFRASEHAREAGRYDPNMMASRVILAAMGDIGLDGLVGPHRAFVNMTRDLLLSNAHEVLPPQSTVVELLEDVPPDDEVLAAVKRLRRRGYGVALDDFVYRPEMEPLVALADIVKIDVLGVDPDAVAEVVERLRPAGAKLLAERVETHEVFAFCKQLGFEYYQGYFFARPQLVSSREVPSNKLTALELLRLIHDPRADFDELEEVIARDVAVSYKLLKHLNSPLTGLRREVRSIREALVMLGERHLRKWASLVVFSSVGDGKSTELLRSSQLRARMCESLAEARDRPDTPPAAAFTAGLFSLLDAMLDQPMDQAISPLGLGDDLSSALTSGVGPVGDLLRLTHAWERADWDSVARLRRVMDLDDEVIRRCAFDAFQWANTLEGL